ncbi:hypothetical protein F5Y04DRAFT_256941 [Hypomontagnella monticulosa]|nr:hypothetical protein F5Y04DRAFT_256941 [Hypomontagnella monticulosa]
MSETNDRTPLLPPPVHSQGQYGQSDSHVYPTHDDAAVIFPSNWSDLQQPIYLRACHSPWRIINQSFLLFLRMLLAGYLSAVFGVSLKYKLENEDEHSRWRIPFQFSTVSFCTQWAWHLQVTVWTAMHLLFPKAIEVDPRDCHGHRLRAYILRFFSPSNKASCPIRRFSFSMFYTMAHVFPFMNTLIYWACLVPAGHGGFKPPSFPHHHPPSNATVAYDPNKGLFEEDPIKAFSIINVWTITTVIAFIEIGFLNSIRRQTPVTGHIVGVMFCSAAYLAWAGVGKLLTGHAGLFFLDPDLMNDMPEAVIAACIIFIGVSPGMFSYMYGLVAMRETMTATRHDSSR